MNLFRLLILGMLAWLIYRVLLSWSSDGRPAKPRPRTPEQFEAMGRCLRCEVFVPRETLSDRGRCRKCERNPQTS